MRAHGANCLTDTHALGNFLQVALRRIPIASDLNPNVVVRHRTPPAIAEVYQEPKTAPQGTVLLLASGGYEGRVCLKSWESSS